ncbi:hypothetical protein I7I51_06796 [Histoplasma capsulatum]|uniref:Uncharacterized protein n=1 Tax=Ajellomyces capsulatus TaxID=5037 RepID=A0A8A1MJ88_AJECA|nr:hypothetical protein I7I51_06796 [Histoplasma capsulatum]
MQSAWFGGVGRLGAPPTTIQIVEPIETWKHRELDTSLNKKQSTVIGDRAAGFHLYNLCVRRWPNGWSDHLVAPWYGFKTPRDTSYKPPTDKPSFDDGILMTESIPRLLTLPLGEADLGHSPSASYGMQFNLTIATRCQTQMTRTYPHGYHFATRDYDIGFPATSGFDMGSSHKRNLVCDFGDGNFFLTEQNSMPGSRLLEIEGPMTFTVILEMDMALQWILTMASRPNHHISKFSERDDLLKIAVLPHDGRFGPTKTLPSIPHYDKIGFICRGRQCLCLLAVTYEPEVRCFGARLIGWVGHPENLGQPPTVKKAGLEVAVSAPCRGQDSKDQLHFLH